MRLFSNGISNELLLKIFSVETIIGILSGVVAATLLWANLNNSVEAAQDAASENTAKLAELRHSVNTLKSDTSAIKTNQDNAVKQIEKLSDEVAKNRDETAEELRIQREDIKRILQILISKG